MCCSLARIAASCNIGVVYPSNFASLVVCCKASGVRPLNYENVWAAILEYLFLQYHISEPIYVIGCVTIANILLASRALAV